MAYHAPVPITGVRRHVARWERNPRGRVSAWTAEVERAQCDIPRVPGQSRLISPPTFTPSFLTMAIYKVEQRQAKVLGEREQCNGG